MKSGGREFIPFIPGQTQCIGIVPPGITLATGMRLAFSQIGEGVDVQIDITQHSRLALPQDCHLLSSLIVLLSQEEKSQITVEGDDVKQSTQPAEISQSFLQLDKSLEDSPS